MTKIQQIKSRLNNLFSVFTDTEADKIMPTSLLARVQLELAQAEASSSTSEDQLNRWDSEIDLLKKYFLHFESYKKQSINFFSNLDDIPDELKEQSDTFAAIKMLAESIFNLFKKGEGQEAGQGVERQLDIFNSLIAKFNKEQKVWDDASLNSQLNKPILDTKKELSSAGDKGLPIHTEKGKEDSLSSDHSAFDRKVSVPEEKNSILTNFEPEEEKLPNFSSFAETAKEINKSSEKYDQKKDGDKSQFQVEPQLKNAGEVQVPRFPLSINRISQLAKAYHRLKKDELLDLIKLEENKFSPALRIMKAGLKEVEPTKIDHALSLIRKSVQQTKIEEPENYSETSEKIISIKGKAEPQSTIRLEVNQKTVKEILVDEDGSFLFLDVEIDFGDNMLVCYNKDFLFLDNVKLHWEIALLQHYPFVGLHDPLTQSAFQADESNMILRCETCEHYMYDFSVEENGGNCVYPKCGGDSFVRSRDPRFWSQH